MRKDRQLVGMGTFAEEYAELSPGEQALFSETVNRLFAEGLVWFEDTGRTQIYTFLRRRFELVRDYLSLVGWQLHYHEQQKIFQVTHREGAHRKHLSHDTTICLLLLRMIYAEQQESNTLRLTRYPAVTLGEVYRRYQELSNARKRWKNKFEESLRQLHRLTLIRLVGGGSLRLSHSQQVIELLPTLEVVVPAGNAQQVAERLAEYGTTIHGDSDSDDDDLVDETSFEGENT